MLCDARDHASPSQHLRLAHRGEERAGHLLARLVYAREHPYCSAAELTERAGPFELQPSDRRPDDRPDLLLRPPPRRLHWVARWLNVLMTEPHPDGGVPQLSLQHVFVHAQKDIHTQRHRQTVRQRSERATAFYRRAQQPHPLT